MREQERKGMKRKEEESGGEKKMSQHWHDFQTIVNFTAETKAGKPT